MTDNPVWKHIARIDERLENVPIPRYYPKDRMVKIKEEHFRSEDKISEYPQIRDIPEQNYHIKMGKYRNEQAKKIDIREISSPHLEGTKNGHLNVKQRTPRVNTLKQPSYALENISIQNETNIAKPESVYLWRNYTGYNSEKDTLSPRFQNTDLRLEKRKERQIAYQQRQAEKKSKSDAMYSYYIQTKNLGFNNQKNNNKVECDNSELFCPIKRVTFA